MKFSEVVTQTLDWLQREGRVSYRALKREFDLDDETLDDLKAELIEVKELAADKDGKMLVWLGGEGTGESAHRGIGEGEIVSSQLRGASAQSLAPNTQPPAAERRQLTVMFCDLVGSTALSARLDPEELREVIRAYQHTCGEIIARYDGHIAQYLGDGLLVYFGYPQAHEDDARRAVRAGLEIVSAFPEQVPSPPVEQASSLPAAKMAAPPEGKDEGRLSVRLGIHTGLVVIGEMGTSGRTEQLALGETPNVAARIQGLAEPNTVLISAATQRLVSRQFESQPFGSHLVKGIETPIAVYHVQGERQYAGLNAGHATPLVGRDQEVGLLQDRWEQVKEGRGQVVLLTGEPGIGKSRLTQTLTEQIEAEGALALEARCSPYHQNSAFYPLIDTMQRALLFTREDTAEEKVHKLERALALYNMPETLPLFAALLSLPLPDTTPLLNLTPQKQKERTIQAMVQWWLTQAERQATVSVWEDLHWADPSTLEFLTLLLEQTPTSQLLVLLTARPEFISPWPPRSHLVTLTLNRLGRRQTEAMITEVAGSGTLPTEVLQQILAKTDGVPLFVEELTKSVVESVGAIHESPLQLAIPPTLQDALMARLDRLSTAKELAQLGATLGREFSYDLLQAISPLEEAALQQGLRQLVESELVYQRGLPPQATYTFKHALIQDAAYHSLLKSRRQQLHQQIAQVLAERFPDTKATQPELLAHHYTEAGLIEQAVPFWQQAGQMATQRFANAESISYLTKGLELLKAVPDSSDRAQQELSLQLALGASLISSKGPGVPEVGTVYNRALSLCRQVGETPQLFPTLAGMRVVYTIRGELQTAREIAEQLLRLAQSIQDPALLIEAHLAVGSLSELLGELTTAREHLEQGPILYDPQQHSSIHRHGLDIGPPAFSMLAQVLWLLGYPQQAEARSREALTRAQEAKLPFGTAMTWNMTAELYQFRREAQSVLRQTEVLREHCHEQEISLYLATATVKHGWSLVMLGKEEEGIQELEQGGAAVLATGRMVRRTYYLALLAEAYGKTGQVEEGLGAIDEALKVVNQTEERWFEAELYRLKGELLLQQAREQVTGNGQQGRVTDP